MTVAQVADATRIRATVVVRHRGATTSGSAAATSTPAATSRASRPPSGIDPEPWLAQFDAEQGAARMPRRRSPRSASPPGHGGGLEQPLGALAGTPRLRRAGDRQRRQLDRRDGAGARRWSSASASSRCSVDPAAARRSPRARLREPALGPERARRRRARPPRRPSRADEPAPRRRPRPTSSPQADGVTVACSPSPGRRRGCAPPAASGTTLFEGTLNQGDTKTFRDKTKVKLVVGNAGAVALTVNGRDLGAPGRQRRRSSGPSSAPATRPATRLTSASPPHAPVRSPSRLRAVGSPA